nr:hypothetical protein CFP56_45581 [Quercus suber]
MSHNPKVPFRQVYLLWLLNSPLSTLASGTQLVEPQVSSTMMRNCLMLQFLKVAEVGSQGSQSEKQYKHLGQTLRKVHEELLAMQDVHDVDNLGIILH